MGLQPERTIEELIENCLSKYNNLKFISRVNLFGH